MTVNTDNNQVLTTSLQDLPPLLTQTRQGGYEFYVPRDITTGQRLRGKAMVVSLYDGNRDDHSSINSVMTKYRESPNAFLKRYKTK